VRQFKPPSVVILNGCSTAARQKSAGFIRQFNRQGVGAVIATNAEVRGEMAGQFLACLEQQLNDKTPLSLAFFLALGCLSKEKPAPADDVYGNRVLVYSLLGNGNLKLCPPK
jgi:hypothetical protein